MTIPRATRVFIPLALLALLAACDRPKAPPPPQAPGAAASAAGGAAAPGTVALSGTILEPQPSPATAKPAATAAGTAAAASTTSGSRARGSTPAYRSGAADNRYAQQGAEPPALRDFQADQERRDRELLDQDLSESQTRAGDEAGDRGPYQLPREDRDWSPSDERLPDEEQPFEEEPIEEPPYDEAPYDEPPYDDEPYDGEPGPDDGYAPRDGAYRP